MVKNILKKTIIFLLPFLLISNIYAADSVIQYTYKATDAEYSLVITVDEKSTSYVKNIKISKLSSENPNTSELVQVTSLSKLFGGLEYTRNYGLNDLKQSFENYSNALDDDEFYKDLVNNPEKYKPILLIDENGDAVLIGSYFNKNYYEETKNLESYNLNDNPEYIEKLLNGSLTFVPEVKNFGNDPINVYDKLKIKKNDKPEYTKTKLDEIDSSDKKDNESYTGGTCNKYSWTLKNLKEKVNNVCSEESLKKMQYLNSIYDLKYKFDANTLEPECKEYIYGNSGYINTINEAKLYYENLESVKDLSCLTMQTEYLEGLSILTNYTSTIKIDKSSCELIDEKTLNFINDLFDIIKIISTCICIFLCIIDIYKIVITKENDGSKFKNILVKRIIALVFVFLTPVIVNIITDLLNERYLQENYIKCADILNK